MENNIKIIVSGLDFAGKTSILTALDKKYDFSKEILQLKPTIKVEYHHMNFLGNLCYFWDMGGQKVFRETYINHQDIYFANTDLIVYIIDIQDKERYEVSIDYLKTILTYFRENNMDVPVIISLHKFDPPLRNDEMIIDRVSDLRERILKEFYDFNILFQQTSIYDIISIVQLISYGLSVFDKQFFEMSNLFESYLDILECDSLILFDKNGIIISEFYREEINPDLYIELLESIKEHLFLLKRMLEENFIANYDFYDKEDKLISYLHKIQYGKYPYYLSVLIEEEKRETLLQKFPELIDEILKIFELIFS